METYPSLHTMTPTVTSWLRPGTSLQDKVAALFPCGSIVGAPKIRAGEIIRALEPSSRGFYTGAIAQGGDMRLIRMAVLSAEGADATGPEAESSRTLTRTRNMTSRC